MLVPWISKFGNAEFPNRKKQGKLLKYHEIYRDTDSFRAKFRETPNFRPENQEETTHINHEIYVDTDSFRECLKKDNRWFCVNNFGRKFKISYILFSLKRLFFRDYSSDKSFFYGYFSLASNELECHELLNGEITNFEWF